MKKILKYTFLVVIILFVGGFAYMFITFPPIITGMGAKVLCSCHYATHRSVENIKKKELQLFPLPFASYQVHPEEQSATGRLLWAESKAIYRKGLGCTLISGISEDSLRNQRIDIPSPPGVDQDTIPWPQGNLVADTLPKGVDREKIGGIIDKHFYTADTLPDINTHAIVVVYEGQIIGEKYADGFNKNSRLMGWSMTKSIMNALVGLAVKKEKLDIEDPAPVARWQGTPRENITLNNLLHASSGLEWSESYFLPGHFHNMFIHSDDKGGYAAQQELQEQPGLHFEYSSGTTNLISKILREELGDSVYHQLPYRELFYPLGMHTALLEVDPTGTFVGSSYGYASARDWARFGLLYLNKGNWLGKQILPTEWVEYSTQPAPPSPSRKKYGAHWWLNTGEDESTVKRFPDMPEDAFMAKGFEGQSLVIIPSRDLVLARLGITHNRYFDLNGLVGDLLKALPPKKEKEKD